MNLPTAKDNPILIALITVIVVIGVFIGGVVTGYYWRMDKEDSANLDILVDDEKFDKQNTSVLHKELNDTAQNAEVLYHYENDYMEICGKCLNTPYSDDMYTIMRGNREREGDWSD